MDPARKAARNPSAPDPASPPAFVFNRYHQARWEITDAHVRAWLRSRFAEVRAAASLGALVNDEFGLLVSDVDCYLSLWERYERGQGPRPAPAVEYFQAGRKGWGLLAVIAREIGLGEDEENEEAVQAPDLGDVSLRPRRSSAPW